MEAKDKQLKQMSEHKDDLIRSQRSQIDWKSTQIQDKNTQIHRQDIKLQEKDAKISRQQGELRTLRVRN